MRKSIVAAVVGMLTAGVTYVNAQTNTGGPFWVQNVSFTLQAQTTAGKRVVTTKDIIADMSGLTVTNTSGGTNGTTVTNSVTVTNHAIFALASGDYTNQATLSNQVTLTFTNGQTTNIPVVSTRTSTNPPTFTFQNTAHTSTNNETVNVFTNGGLPLGTLTAVLVTTNGGTVFTVTGTTTTGGGGGSNVVITLPTFARNAKLIVKRSSPSGPASATNSTAPGRFYVRVGTAKSHTDTEVSGLFEQTDTASLSTTKGNTTSVFNDFNFAYKGNSAFDARGVGKNDFGTVKGADQRKSALSTIVGSGLDTTDSPFTVSGKYNITGGAVEQQ